jgi:GDPmannose 4,6-dehydratase
VTRALVTGVTGQDGGYLAELLVAGGDEVHAVVRPGRLAEPLPGHLAALGDALVLHEADLLDPAAVRALVTALAPSEVYNLAAQSSVARSWDDPVGTALLGAVLPAVLLDAAGALGGGVRVLQASSAEVFAGAGPSHVPQSEATPLAPTNPYGAAKAHAQHLVATHRARGLHAVAVVLYPHESPRRPTAFVTRKITSTVAAIARGEAEELVLGNTAARRDWGWAPDVVAAMVAALRHPEPQDYVVATGVSHAVEDFVRVAAERAGVGDWRERLRVDPAFLRPTDATDLVGDATRARTALGWAPTRSFEEVVAAMVDADLAG